MFLAYKDLPLASCHRCDGTHAGDPGVGQHRQGWVRQGSTEGAESGCLCRTWGAFARGSAPHLPSRSPENGGPWAQRSNSGEAPRETMQGKGTQPPDGKLEDGGFPVLLLCSQTPHTRACNNVSSDCLGRRGGGPAAEGGSSPPQRLPWESEGPMVLLTLFQGGWLGPAGVGRLLLEREAHSEAPWRAQGRGDSGETAGLQNQSPKAALTTHRTSTGELG